MSEQDKISTQEIIMAAIKSIDWTEYQKSEAERGGARRNEAALDRAITRRALKIQKLLSERSFPSKVLEATRIAATIKDIKFEDSSKRYLITFRADNSNDDADETIRSERTDGANGDNVLAMWDPKRLVGRHVMIYKYNEMPSEDTKRSGGRNVPSHGYRCAVYVHGL